jgi:two-component system, NarL family, sensor kinase
VPGGSGRKIPDRAGYLSADTGSDMHHDGEMTQAGRRSHWFAVGLFALAMAEAVATLVGVVATALPFAVARDSFLISNAALGVGCAVCGVLIAVHRHRNPLGWLLLGAAVAQTATPVVTPWLFVALRDGWSDAAVRSLATAYSGAWPWSVSVFVPLAILFFPDGRLLSRPWRGVVAVALVNAPLQVLLFSSDPNPLSTVDALGSAGRDRGTSWLMAVGLLRMRWLEMASDLVLGATYLAGFLGLVVRFRRGDERTRRQLLWLLLAAAVVSAMMVTSRLPGGSAAGGSRSSSQS